MSKLIKFLNVLWNEPYKGGTINPPRSAVYLATPQRKDKKK